MISYSDLKTLGAQSYRMKFVDRILTSEEILTREVFDEPQVITEKYFNFNNLIMRRNMIRDLRLMPLKEETLHEAYNALSREKLLDDINIKMGQERMILLPNEYPYHLPKDALQYILWIKKSDTPRIEITRFLARLMKLYKLDDLDVILFERSFVSKSKFVKRSFPFIRHVHVWIRKKHEYDMA